MTTQEQWGNTYYQAHDCKKAGYHRLGVPVYLDTTRRLFVRHCKSCAYVYAAKIKVSSEGKVGVDRMNEDKSNDNGLT